MTCTGMRLAVAAIAGVAVCGWAQAQPQPSGFEGASWIWTAAQPEEEASRPAAGVRFFRAALTVSEQSPIKTGELFITADNLYIVYVNGKPAGESHPDPNAWRKPKRFDVASLLLPGHNVIGVEAVNTIPGPAGLLVKVDVQLADGASAALVSNASWKSSAKEEPDWHLPSFDDNPWRPARIVAPFGAKPWGKFAAPAEAQPAGELSGNIKQLAKRSLEGAQGANSAAKGRARPVLGPGGGPVTEAAPAADYRWPEAIAFLGDDCTLYRVPQRTGTAADSLNVTVFIARKSRAYPEHDLPAPVKMGRKLFALKPARPGTTPRLLLDAGKGAIGSPSVSFDGQWIYVAMAKDGEPFFHIYRLAADGSQLKRLTDGPFHDIDPVELADGRIAFTSTRVGMFDEYHCPPARALFAMNPDGNEIRPLTHTFIFDNEPEVMADGRILFIRSDNFFDRGKVETLLHAIHPDGTEGYTEFGLDNGPEYGGRLRAFYCGSPAPLPDGRVAFVSGPGITLARPGWPLNYWRHFQFEAGDVAALPDGRLLCTAARRITTELPETSPPAKRPAAKAPARPAKASARAAVDLVYDKIGLIRPDAEKAELVTLYQSSSPLHSPVYLGPRPRPPVLPAKVARSQEGEPTATGVLFCQNARFTKHATAGWPHVRAIRVLAGKGLTVRSSHSYIVHAGTEAIELGTVPLAPDGSFAVEVPADTAIAFQAVDGEGRTELNEMSWIYVRPGERRGCVGCHHSRQATPLRTAMPLALQTRPLRLLGQGTPHRFRGNNAAVTGLMELQWDRYREVAGLNRHSQTREPLATGLDEVAAAAAALTGQDAGQRHSAANRLAVFRQPSAAHALAVALKDADREVRVAAAVALAACGTRESLSPLLDALDDPDPLARQAAAMALENLTAHAQPFDAFAPDTARREQAAAWRSWFQAAGWEGIEADLVQRLAQADRDQQRRAAVAMGHVGGPAACAALRAYVTAHRDSNPYPEWKKEHRGDGTRFNSLAPVNPRALQAAVRAIGCLTDTSAVPMLAETLGRHSDPAASNLFLAEAAVEALGRIATPEAEAALLAALPKLKDYFYYVGWYGDHSALFACHASPVHYFIAESLDAMGSRNTAKIAPELIRSIPTDVDRALFPQNDDCEAVVGRVIRRGGAEAAVVETCLAILGDAQAAPIPEIQAAIGTVYAAWGGKPEPENRAAQILSLVCRDRKYEPRVRAAFLRYQARPNGEIPRVFDTGIPQVRALPVKHWVCFFLARSLGNLADPHSVDALLAALGESPAEAADGHPDPCGPGVLFLHNDLTPCWRAAVAWALGEIGDRRAVPVLLAAVKNLDNAVDTRHAAAEALGRIADPAGLAAIRELAAGYPEVSTRRALLTSFNRKPQASASRDAKPQGSANAGGSHGIRLPP